MASRPVKNGEVTHQQPMDQSSSGPMSPRRGHMDSSTVQSIVAEQLQPIHAKLQSLDSSMREFMSSLDSVESDFQKMNLLENKVADQAREITRLRDENDRLKRQLKEMRL